jgi:hypothetical protein
VMSFVCAVVVSLLCCVLSILFAVATMPAVCCCAVATVLLSRGAMATLTLWEWLPRLWRPDIGLVEKLCRTLHKTLSNLPSPIFQWCR